MAKSLGNIAALHEVVAEHGRDTVVMYLVSGHYRQPLAFSPAELEGAGRSVARLREALGHLREGEAGPPDMAVHREAFFASLANDFNTPAALSSMFEWVREANRRKGEAGDRDLREMLDVVGLGELAPLRAAPVTAAMDARAKELLDERERARARRDFATADAIRDQLRELGWEIRDGPQGPELLASAGR
jgi:cysteinyl-tRNA synthetase